MNLEIPAISFAGVPVSAVLALLVWLIRKHGVGTAMSVCLLLFGAMTFAMCAAIFACKVFTIVPLTEDVGHWLIGGTIAGTGLFGAAGFAHLCTVPEAEPPVQPATKKA